MNLNVIKVGNSKGLRIPKAILEEYQIKDQIEITLKEDYIELRPINQVRENWEAKFKEMSENDHDGLLIPDVFEDEEI